MSRREHHPALRRALLAARDKREERGAAGDGTVVTPSLTPEEALALDGLLSRRKPILPGQPLRIALSQFETALREYWIDPRTAYEAVGGRPPRDRPAERAAAAQSRTAFHAWLADQEVARERPPVAAFLQDAARQGRLRAENRPLVERALRVIAELPRAEPIQRTVLAAELLEGDPHGLDADTPMHRLTVSLLTVAAGLAEPTPARDVWAAWNVLVDPVASTVTVLNLPPPDDGRVGELLRLMSGSHVVLTHGLLSEHDLRWSSGFDCFACENPSVLIAAERALGASCPPLVCTGGRPSDAVRLLLESLHAGGVRVRHHGDFDLAGVQIFRDLESRYGAIAWRFDVASLGDALGGRGRDVPDSRGPTLEAAVNDLEVGVAEELVIDALLKDLCAAAGDGQLRQAAPNARRTLASNADGSIAG